MSSTNGVPDAWDDDWVAAADVCSRYGDVYSYEADLSTEAGNPGHSTRTSTQINQGSEASATSRTAETAMGLS